MQCGRIQFAELLVSWRRRVRRLTDGMQRRRHRHDGRRAAGRRVGMVARGVEAFECGGRGAAAGVVAQFRAHIFEGGFHAATSLFDLRQESDG